MTADDEVRNICWTLEKIHRALYQVDNEFENAVPEVNNALIKLEQIITNVAIEANNIRDTTIKIISNFPDYSVYLMIILMLEITAVIIIFALFYFNAISFNQFYHKYFIPYDERKNGKLLRKSDKKDMQKCDAKALIYYSPSLSFSPFDIPYDKSDKEWWIEMHNLDNQQLIQIENT
ncbi:Bifunctional DNA-directed RNA polymerase subunit beta-beta' [Dirofilaria immitis]